MYIQDGSVAVGTTGRVQLVIVILAVRLSFSLIKVLGPQF